MTKGVRLQKSGRYISWCRDGKKTLYCGTYTTEEDARLARVKALVETKGEAHVSEEVKRVFQENSEKVMSTCRRRIGTTGIKGVCLKRRPGKPASYECKFRIAGRIESFGVYSNIEEAAAKADEVVRWRASGCVGNKPLHKFVS